MTGVETLRGEGRRSSYPHPPSSVGHPLPVPRRSHIGQSLQVPTTLRPGHRPPHDDPTVVMSETTAVYPPGWSPLITARPAPARRDGHAHHRPTRRGRWWAHLLVWGGGTSVAAAALAWAWPTAGPVITVTVAGLLP